MDKITIYPASDNSLMLQGLGSKLSEFQKLLTKEFQSYILDFTPAYGDLLVFYDLLSISHQELTQKIESLWQKQHQKLVAKTISSKNIINIPVYYGLEVGWDLLAISKEKNISVDDIIKMHNSATYKVLAVGFRPGFAYLGGLRESLHLLRRQNARINIPRGSVAIANSQSAIYPSDGAGGWNIIGKTFLSMLDWKKQYPCLLRMGDIVHFTAITKNKFLQAGGKIIKE